MTLQVRTSHRGQARQERCLHPCIVTPNLQVCHKLRVSLQPEEYACIHTDNFATPSDMRAW